MFDSNRFKREIKEWVKVNPDGTLLEFADFCEDLIPAQQYAANKWLLDQSLDWFRHIIATRESHRSDLGRHEEECC